MEIIEENKLTKETLTGEGNKIEGYFGNLVNDDEGMKVDDSLKNQEVEGIEVVEDEKEGLFGNLVDGDEDMKVNSDKNGMSLVMDVDEFCTGENGSEVNIVFEGNVNAGEDPMDVCISVEKEKKDKNRMEIFEFKDYMNKDGEGNVDNGEDNGSKDDTNKNMHDGRMVENGGKLAANADTNKKIEVNVENKEDNGGELADDEEQDDNGEEDHDFVVGDFVWGKIKTHPWWPGQIYDPSDASDYADTQKRKGRLLVAYFGDGSFSWCSPSQLKPFIDNFKEMSTQSDSKKFVNAVQKAMEEVSRLLGAELMCKCDAVADRVDNGGVLNSGIKEGVPVPKGNTVKVLMDRLQPDELVTTLKDSATMEPGTRLFKLELAVLKSCLSAFYRRKGGYSLVEYHDSKCIEGLEDKSKSGTLADSDVNGPLENGDDKLYQKRKKKSVAELLGEDETKIKKAKTLKDGGSGTVMKRERKRKPLVVSVTAESDHESGGGVEEGTMSPRQRKKSKYLSPPYLSPVGNGKLSISGSGSGSFKEPKTESEKVPEMAAEQLEESFKTSSGKKFRCQKSRLRERPDSKEDDKKMIDANMDVNKVLHGLLHAALDPTAFMEKTLPAITDFISSFRRSIFKEGSIYPFTDGKKDSPMTLVIEFPPEAILPTKADLLKTYKKFGDLIKKETQSDGSSAFVVFRNSSDAEAALAMSLEKNPFGDVKYHVSVEAVSSVKTSSRKVVVEDPSGFAFIMQKLETMSQMVQRCDENQMSAVVKASLEEGIKDVLDKVGNMRAK